MAEITSALVKELRVVSGAGVLDCKKALVATDGDIDNAIDWLRKNGLSKAAKKADRVAAEGLIGLKTNGSLGVMIEVNSETDFVARNEQFQKFVDDVLSIVETTGDDIDALKKATYPGASHDVAEELINLIATIGENLSLRRAKRFVVDNGVVGGYIHNGVTPTLGKIGVLVALESDGKADVLSGFAKSLSMHVAATQPQAISVDNLDQASVERERAVLKEQIKDLKKPQEILDKMIEGRLRKFYQEVVLLEQTFVVDGENKISKVVEGKSKEAGGDIKIVGFDRFKLGEGIEKEEKDFSEEVAAQLKG
jgi:elongation factor Ts